MTANDDAAHVRKFAEDLTRIQRSLYAYICTLVGCPMDAQDVLQDTNREVWERYEEFEPGSSLAAWTYKIAHYRVLTMRKQRSRRRQRFQEATLNMLAERLAETSDVIDARHQALLECIRRLKSPDGDLIEARYLDGVEVVELSQKLTDWTIIVCSKFDSPRTKVGSVASARRQMVRCLP